MAEMDAVSLDKADLTFGNDPMGALAELTGITPDAQEEPETPEPETPPPEAAGEPADAEDTADDSADDDEAEDAPETPDAPTEPDPAPAPEATLEALLKAGKPLTYTVDGQTKETADIVEIAGRGAVIPPEALNRIRDRLQQSDRLGEQNKRLFTDVQGRDATIAEMERKVASLDAAGSLLLDLLADSATLGALVRTDGNGNVYVDPTQRELLMRQVKVAAKEAEYRAREAWEQKATEAQSTERDAETRRALMDEQLTSLTADLTPDDQAAARAFFAPLAHLLYRKATAEDAKAYPGVVREGQEMFDAPRIAAWVEDRRALRAQLADAQKAKAVAQKHNAAVQTATKPLPPRKKNGEFTKAPKAPDAKKTPLSRFERNLRARAGLDPFGRDE